MWSEGTDATTACYRVGYESALQFSREYRCLFGESPYHDIARLRGTIRRRRGRGDSSALSHFARFLGELPAEIGGLRQRQAHRFARAFPT